MITDDEKYMREALKEAKKAYDLGETPIGCVIVRTEDYDGKPLPKPIILSRGYNRRNTDRSTLSHAEITAIRKAAKKLGDWRLQGCTIYVTLEPCPMCAGALLQGRIDRVVIGAMNPKAGCVGSVLNLLDRKEFNHRASITTGLLQEESADLLDSFFRKLRREKGTSGKK